MEFRKATLSDLKTVTAIFQAAVHHMDEQGIPQWDELYPAEEDLKGDILRSEMTLGLENGAPVCTFTLNRDCDPSMQTEHGGTPAPTSVCCTASASRLRASTVALPHRRWILLKRRFAGKAAGPCGSTYFPGTHTPSVCMKTAASSGWGKHVGARGFFISTKRHCEIDFFRNLNYY